MSLEVTTFGENEGCTQKGHIHSSICYVMFSKNRAGLAKINRALKPYHHLGKEYGDITDSAVGNPHEICLIRERLQALRFELL